MKSPLAATIVSLLFVPCLVAQDAAPAKKTQGATIGDLTWVDSNGNGRQDPTEDVLPNVVVRLYSGGAVVATTTSTVAGAYAFTDLRPGRYTVGFLPPAGYMFTTSNVADDAADSDANEGSGLTTEYTLAAGQANVTVDAGFRRSQAPVKPAAVAPAPVRTETRRAGRAAWVLDMHPASILANMEADGFAVDGEEVSLVSAVPTILVGPDIACLDGYLNLRLGVGMLLNAQFGTWMGTAQAGYSIEIQRNVMFGPHIAISRYAAPDWWGDTEISFDPATGWNLGLHVVAGDRIAYLLSVDYMHMSFDVNPDRPDTDSELDTSGVAVQFGLRVQF
jgi:hypothetical protein